MPTRKDSRSPTMPVDVIRTAESSPRNLLIPMVRVRCGSSYQGFIQLIGPRKSCFPTSTPLWRRIA